MRDAPRDVFCDREVAPKSVEVSGFQCLQHGSVVRPVPEWQHPECVGQRRRLVAPHQALLEGRHRPNPFDALLQRVDQRIGVAAAATSSDRLLGEGDPLHEIALVEPLETEEREQQGAIRAGRIVDPRQRPLDDRDPLHDRPRRPRSGSRGCSRSPPSRAGRRRRSRRRAGPLPAGSRGTRRRRTAVGRPRARRGARLAPRTSGSSPRSSSSSAWRVPAQGLVGSQLFEGAVAGEARVVDRLGRVGGLHRLRPVIGELADAMSAVGADARLQLLGDGAVRTRSAGAARGCRRACAR